MRQRVDVAFGRVGAPHLLGQIVLVDLATAGQVGKDRADDVGVLGRGDASIVGQGANLPQPLHPGRRIGEPGDFGIAHQKLKRALVDRRQRAGQPVLRRRHLQRRAQGGKRGEVDHGGTPLHHLHGIEVMAFDAPHQLLVEDVGVPGDAEGTVAHVAPGASGDLAKLGGRQVAVMIAVELARLGEGDVIDIEVEAHADGVGGDKKVDIAGLVELHLGVAGARRQRAQDNGGAAALTPDQFGDGVDLVGGERDDRGTARKPRDLLRSRPGEVRHARACHHVHAAQHPLQDGPHRQRAQQQGLAPSAQVQDAVGEDVAAFEIGGQLHLVDGDEVGRGVTRQRLDGADRKARAGGLDLLLAGDERDVSLADLLADTLIDLARQQAQRQADQPGRMRHHALDG